jgi:hypothetical protein
MPDAVVPLAAVPAIVEERTGRRPSRQTVYNWVSSGKLDTLPHRPLRTTVEAVLGCISELRLKP